MFAHSKRGLVIAAAVISISVAGVVAGTFVRRLQAREGSGNLAATTDVAGRERAYFVHLPPKYDGKQARPVVLVLHGGMESPEGVEKMSGMSRKADAENFVAVYPRGTGRLATTRGRADE